MDILTEVRTEEGPGSAVTVIAIYKDGNGKKREERTIIETPGEIVARQLELLVEKMVIEPLVSAILRDQNIEPLPYPFHVAGTVRPKDA